MEKEGVRKERIMNRKPYIVYLVVVLVLLTSTALPQGRTKQAKKGKSSSSTASQVPSTSSAAAAISAVTGNVAAEGPLSIATSGVNTTQLANNAVMAVKIAKGMVVRSLNGLSDNVTLEAGSNITITLSGNTLKIDAPNVLSSSVAHDTTLTGDGSASTPLGLAVPLFFTGNVPRNNFGLLDVINVGAAGKAITALGGPSDSNFRGGFGLQAEGGDRNKNTGGTGLLSGGGIGINHDGGTGGAFLGGAASNGSGGNGAFLQGGSSTGAGHKGGNGLTAFAGGALDGAKTGLAGEFLGDVTISGNLSKGGGSFKIDHPLDPENKYLYHSFVESRDMKNMYDGTVTTDANGDAMVTLPDWFEALNQDFRYQLTVIGTFAQAIVAEEIKGNRFVVKTNAPNVKVSWQVTGIRHDAYANKHRIPIEEQKPEEERGLFLHPDAFNQPEDKGVQFVKMTPQIEKTKAASQRTTNRNSSKKEVGEQ